MDIKRLSPAEFAEQMRSCREWAFNINLDLMELQLTVLTQADIFEQYLGPDPRDMNDSEKQAFKTDVERLIRIYTDRNVPDISPWYRQVGVKSYHDIQPGQLAPEMMKYGRTPHKMVIRKNRREE
jgi:hypothetical protein